MLRATFVAEKVPKLTEPRFSYKNLKFPNFKLSEALSEHMSDGEPSMKKMVAQNNLNFIQDLIGQVLT